ncbi:hypothetical protein P152DRAFT_393836 [Eremomyces bilateralis CBS 781.70]|uniref:Nitrogen regulatory protein areA GATA-like domain-containing protein n=1 Tax=Eremomyces bilateralis CBS 781.70 TaxID=1392243 RepID=A0A6G1G6R5_9PEZI|nr:uncharacterized protein P152DRAFT_393836 [Eremomyces bilateralis CBS 781.70]KAF1813651.1 hypothetical protein P152DRAFT_393836 [Eremomyces bilateralis CBS 781.70]
MAAVLPPSHNIRDGQYFNSSLRRTSPSRSAYRSSSPSYPVLRSNSCASTLDNPSLPNSAPPSSRSSQIELTRAAGLPVRSRSNPCLSTGFGEEEISFPAYGRSELPDQHEDLEPPTSPRTENSYTTPSSAGDSTETTTPDAVYHAEDDTSIKPEPTRHVDYLSYDWREEDIWSSWRHIVAQRRVLGERSRLENASWRQWAKQQNKLKTVAPESLNWLKDCDVTWLYGPLQTATSIYISQQMDEPPSKSISRSNSFLAKKPILKKRSMSEIMLQKSLSAASLLKQATAAVQAQQGREARRGRPILYRAISDFIPPPLPSKTISRDGTVSSSRSSGLHTPNGERKHIRFDDKVEQCIAVDQQGEDDEAIVDWGNDSDSDDGIIMMKPSKKKPLSRTHSRTSFASDSKTIAMLPATTLKYRTDSPDILDHPSHSLPSNSFWRSPRFSPSPSQETLRPSRPSANFLLDPDDDDDDPDISWEPSLAYASNGDSPRNDAIDGAAPAGSGAMRRTASGMFMPYEDDREEEPGGESGLFGRVVDSVNTAKDIAHVIWNVGWRR